MTDMADVAPREADVPEAVRKRGEFTRAVVEAATSRPGGVRWRSAIQCVGRAAGKRCRGRTEVGLRNGVVDWSCEGCGDSGAVTGFAGGEADLSAYLPRGKTVAWGFSDDERELLLAATTHIPELRGLVSRARPHREVPGLLLVEASVAELNEIYTLIEELTGATRSRRRIELLDDLRASLSGSIDGF